MFAADMTLMSGQVVALNELYNAAQKACCIPQSTLGDYTPIVRMDSSNGQFYATSDPDCKTAPVTAESYPATYRAIWACGKCQNGKCPAVDGGERTQAISWSSYPQCGACGTCLSLVTPAQ